MALEFDGNGDYVTYGTILNTLTKPTLFFGWTYSDTNSMRSQIMINIHPTGGGIGITSEVWDSTENLGCTKFGVADISSGLNHNVNTWIFFAVEIRSDWSPKFWRVLADGTVSSATSANTSAILTGSANGAFRISAPLPFANADTIDGKLSWIGAYDAIGGGFSDNEIRGLAFCPFRVCAYGRPDVLVPCEGIITTVENYGKSGGTGTVSGNTVKWAGNPPIQHMENYI